ncbi:MAG: DegT/DnrJ/EryC1/StrS family aminotransferase [bacterium]|nr:DegT/DnrJ/EryC1/StrS family aminotransferase [bacterium]
MILANDFKREDTYIGPAIRRAIDRVLSSGWYVLGKEVDAFEHAFADFNEVEHAIGVASGTDALSVALAALGIGVGDEVITSALTAFPTITGISRVGATPVAVDVHPHTGLINPDCIRAAITKNTKAIIPVHLYGKMCDMPAIMQIAAEYGLKIVEDCAQSVGASYEGRLAGSWGDAAAFSFYPTKNLGAYGDGGAVVTNNEVVASRARQLRDYGQDKKFSHLEVGFNSRLDELQAAVLSEKLDYLTEWNNRRRSIAKRYDELLEYGTVLHESRHDEHAFHLYVVTVKNRDKVLHAMRDFGIQCQVHYPKSIDLQPGYLQVAPKNAPKCPEADALTKSIISLPIFPYLTDQEVDTVIGHFNQVVAHVG